MGDILSDLLFYPFEKSMIPWPLEDSKVLIINGQHSTLVPKNSTIIQFFKPYADKWVSQSFKVLQEFENAANYDYTFVVLSKQKEESHYFLAQAVNNLKIGGMIIAVAANDAGGARLEKWMRGLGLETQNLSKKKCRIVWAKKENIIEEKCQEFEQAGIVKEIILDSHKVQTQAGIYGWKTIDQGSKILIDVLSDKLTGIGADLGCGYGYLSMELLKKYPDIQKLYSIDADYRAVQCAKENLNIIAHKAEKEFLWHDLTTHPDRLSLLDFIVMNPPFHEGKKTDSNIGQNFIQTAAKSLRNKGVLYMVANVHLPYEKILDSEFSSVEKLAEKNGFKVFKAVK